MTTAIRFSLRSKIAVALCTALIALPTMVAQVNADANDAPANSPNAPLFAQVSQHNHTCAVDTVGDLWCWGSYMTGVTTTPTRVQGLVTPVKAVSTGSKGGGADGVTCVIDANSAAKCWGYNGEGQIGDGTNLNRSTPTQVSGLTSGVRAISSSIGTSCALLETNEVACWGSGIGNSPARVSVPSDTIALATSGSSRCILRSSGTVSCWGDNTFGQLGLGNTTDQGSPTQVPGLSNVDNITAGAGYFCAHKGDNSVACWGYNGQGQLGNGNTIDQSSPTPVPPPAMTGPYVSVHAGLEFTCALTTGGQIACWGDNSHKQLGDGTTTDSTSAKTIPGITGAIGLTMGTASACAVLADRTLKCWGVNVDGRLSVGTSVDESTPRALVGFGTLGTTTTSTTSTTSTTTTSTTTTSTTIAPASPKGANSSSLWTTKRLKGTYGGTVVQSSTASATKTFTLPKKSVTLFFQTGPSAGKVRVSSPRASSRTVDLYSKTAGSKSVTLTTKSTSLQSVTLTVLGSKNVRSKGTTVAFDAYTTTGKTCGKGCVRSPK